MTFESFHRLFWREFESIKHGAEFFHVKPVTVRRWLRGEIPINPMAEKLLIIKAIGYLPNDVRWAGFRIDERRAVLITPGGREFNPKELEAFAIWKDEHRQLVERHGHIESPTYYPAKPSLLPFRGGRRMTAAPWIPTKFK
ncbi:phage protein [Vibrio fluvialis]|nr:phage protein [Vibrio fluvialis]ELL4666616.1 phage protein [Vibrio fluvialis]